MSAPVSPDQLRLNHPASRAVIRWEKIRPLMVDDIEQRIKEAQEERDTFAVTLAAAKKECTELPAKIAALDVELATLRNLDIVESPFVLKSGGES